jgi:adenosylcobinamide-phosphate synthase
MYLLLALLTLLAELLVGYPQRLVGAIGHPVIWIGSLIGYLDRTLNRAAWSDRRRRIMGVVALVVIVVAPVAVASALVWAFGMSPLGVVLIALVGSSMIAQRSLATHVTAVAEALEKQGLEGGRKAVSMIVGRDPERLDEAGVSRAAIESLAENFSDGVVAPAFWLAVGGLPAAVAYKAVNTADSMIGHKNEHHRAFGWASARFDDLVNLPASRLSALLIIVAALIVPGASAGNAWRAVWRDARHHRSPNAGWPEAAMAGALGISIAGARYYGGVLADDSEMGKGGRRDLTAGDIRAALKLYWAADILMIAIIGAGAALVILLG